MEIEPLSYSGPPLVEGTSFKRAYKAPSVFMGQLCTMRASGGPCLREQPFNKATQLEQTTQTPSQRERPL